ncbi:threonine dehydrogenase-like Zn-dependent dehydrogenase [Aequitasia blattaphilus]|uniref:Alcohol dehydrogenase catalytic domain-containing protein n=1 Tax=Aequitasia blattaphilus TaxID=2949332 RepID=A0ABT1EC00_9FIRM|nr:alcohol dehydrogenase catalytic domain-containing protein [Aequitasia blattaphilus]MCP1103338.1 alcohol dehydrogenase catalytic domain-containing protein [Aequitasia blattaphilus]MCR8615978.1 alcohol dehydrogenase catalytic domain-containing protein [Aequitasia blattaphilus]
MKSISVVKVGKLNDPDEEKKGKVAVLDIEEQEVGDEDVKIKVAYCAICGSDPHLVENIFGWDVPFGLGHEVSGVIVELGKKATKKGLKVGDRVAGNFLKFCGTCYYCQNGQQQFCEHGDEYNRPGMSEYIVWHESQVYKLPDNVSLKEGCMLEPISIAVRMMDKVNPRYGERIAISGGGPIGLLAIQSIVRFGGTSVTLIEPIEARRELGLKYGAEHVIDPTTQSTIEEGLRITEGRGFDTVIDCSGSVRAVGDLPKITARGGKLIYGAMYPKSFEMPFNLYEYCYFNELTVTGFYVAPYAFPRAIQSLSKYQLEDFISKEFFIDDAEAAFAAQVSGKYPKILIHCNKDL